jgi:hypothetical protein
MLDNRGGSPIIKDVWVEDNRSNQTSVPADVIEFRDKFT